MLKNLEILNGEMPLKFDSLNTIYTINVDPNVDYLELNYEAADDYEVSFINPLLEYGTNEIVLTVYNDEEMLSYYLYVYKEEAMNVNSYLNQVLTLETNASKEVPKYAVPIISVVCFFTILLFFTLLFQKKKKR